MQQIYKVAVQLLDGMTITERAWYTRENKIFIVTFYLSKEEIEHKIKGTKICALWCHNFISYLKSSWKKERLALMLWECGVQILMILLWIFIQWRGEILSKPRWCLPIKLPNKGWYPSLGLRRRWKERDQEWRHRNPTWINREKDRYVSPHDQQKPNDS